MNRDSTSALGQADLLAIEKCCDQFEQAWREWRGGSESETPKPMVEDYLGEQPEHRKPALIRELVSLEMEYRSAGGDTLLLNEFRNRFPDTDSGVFINLLQESVSDVTASKGRASSFSGQTSPTENSDASFSAAAVDEHPQVPKQIGQYEIVGVLGTGGMGTVYQGLHREMQREVAVKVMRSDLTDQESLKKRFRREVLAAAKLIHPNIVTAYDAGEMPTDGRDQGQPFLVSELVHGVDLKHHIQKNGPMPYPEALRSIRHAANGLAYAHSHDVIHRDIKPANLLLEPSGNVKILDMGLARLSLPPKSSDNEQTAADPDLTAQLTNTGIVMGTAGYMAPEQARNTRLADARSDIYSLGCVLFYLLQGRAPYRGESMVETILAHATEPIPVLKPVQGNIPAGVTSLVQRMMAKSPDHRYQSMQEVIEQIDGIIGSPESQSSVRTPEVVPPPVATANDVQKPTPQTITGKGWLIGALWLVLAAGIGSWWFGRPGSIAPQPTGPNRGVLFDGQSSYLEIPSIQRGPGEAVTLELITRLDGSNGPANPVCWLGDNWTTVFHHNGWGMGRKQNGESLFAWYSEDVNTQEGKWVHVAGTYEGNELNLFIDGQPVVSDEIYVDLEETTPGLFIGGVDPSRLQEPHHLRFYLGVIDAVRIVERVVYPAGESFEPPKRLEKVEGTLVLYQFDEPTGSDTFADSSGNDHTAKSFNAKSVLVKRQ